MHNTMKISFLFTIGILFLITGVSAYQFIDFSDVDENSDYLNSFDEHGVKVWLEIEPGSANVDELIDLVLLNYKDHSSIRGVAIDVEWLEYLNYNEGRAVSDAEVTSWINKIRSYNPDYDLMLIHWDVNKMPSIQPEGVIFNNDGQSSSDLNNFLEGASSWGNSFNGDVGYTIGFPSDRAWWQELLDPAGEISNSLFQEVENTEEVLWASWTINEIYAGSSIDYTSSGDKYAGIVVHPSGNMSDYSPEYWSNAAKFIASKSDSKPIANWVVGVAWEGGISHLTFPEIEIPNQEICIDDDNDGYSTNGEACGIIDCNDNDFNINPGVNEICDEIDNDCDGQIDEGCDASNICQFAISATSTSENVAGSFDEYVIGSPDAPKGGICSEWSGYGYSWTPENWDVKGVLTLNYDLEVYANSLTIFGDYDICWNKIWLRNSKTGQQQIVFDDYTNACIYSQNLSGDFLADSIVLETCGWSWSATDAVELCGLTNETEGPVNICGNDVIEQGEQCEIDLDCDDGDVNTLNTCVSCGCETENLPFCGNGIIDEGEMCELNSQCVNTDCNGFDGCLGNDYYDYHNMENSCNACNCENNSCVEYTIIYNDERCVTSSPVCGNGIVEEGEQCDDGNTKNNDSCNKWCQVKKRGKN